MKTKILIILIVLIFLASGCVQLTEPIVLTGRTEIEKSGTYILNDDISCAELGGEEACIVIFANNVMLDCQGHTITGPERSPTGGIEIISHHVTIKNCNVQKFRIGIRAAHNGFHSIVNNTASNNTFIGIYLDNAWNNTLINNTANYNRWGIYLFLESNNNILINNTANNNAIGFYLIDSSTDNVFIDNHACGNGISIDKGDVGDIVCEDNSTLIDRVNNICLRNLGCENVICNAGC